MKECCELQLVSYYMGMQHLSSVFVVIVTIMIVVCCSTMCPLLVLFSITSWQLI
mgnify:CR=1 FL=1